MLQDLSVGATHMALSILRMLRPHRVQGLNKTRVGRFFDGGYVMLDSFENVAAAYSLGINDDVSWDLDIASRRIPIYQYDHTIEQLPVAHELFRWEKLGIASAPDPANRLETLSNLIVKNGHEACDDLILKCDIEGYEWGMLAGTPSSVIRQFRQIVLEVHDLHEMRRMDFANLVRRAVYNLSSSHRVIHVHANNFAPWAVVGGVTVPAVLELTFARLDQGEFVVSDEIFPTSLDMPCHSRDADFYLGRFAFD